MGFLQGAGFVFVLEQFAPIGGTSGSKGNDFSSFLSAYDKSKESVTAAVSSSYPAKNQKSSGKNNSSNSKKKVVKK